MRFVQSSLHLAILTALSTTAYANSQVNEEDKIPLIPIVLTAQAPDEIGQTKYNQEQIQNIPNSSKNITDFLQVNPNVQFSNDHRSGRQQGNLSAADISINGALPYDNKFLINGVSVNNNINPASSASYNSNSDLMGTSQTVSVNTDLLCNIEVLDSNISAEYGQFQGGVVSAETCKPTTAVGELHGTFAYDYTSDDWSRINFVSNEEKIAYQESVSDSIQPRFTKQGISGSLYGNLSDQWGLSLSAASRWSSIPLTTALKDPSEYKQSRENYDVSLEAFYHPSDRTQIKFGAQFFENVGNFFQSNARNSASDHTSNSQSFFLQAKQQFDQVNIEHQINYQTQTSDRRSATDMYSWLVSETKDWNLSGTLAQEGNFGGQEQQEKKLEYDVKATFKPLQTGLINHTFRMGAGYGHYDAYWKRTEDSHWYSSFVNLNGAECADYTACDSGLTTAGKFNGQYARTRTVYGAGEIELQQDRWYAFLENKMQYDQYATATLGMRTDYDSITGNRNLAPRSSLQISPFGNEQLKLTTGWNRYYGLNAFFNELQDQKRTLQRTETRKNVQDQWDETEGSRYARMPVVSQLDTPYTDETVFAISGRQANLDWALKWVNRDGRDQVRRTEDITLAKPEGSGTYSIYSYDNSGTSSSDIYTLSLKTVNPLQFKGTSHGLELAASYTDTIRSFDSYDSKYDDPNKEIYYDGKLMELGSKPADNYNTPWSVRALWNIGFAQTPLKIHNLFKYSASTDRMLFKANGYVDELGKKYDSYTATRSPSSFYWDIRTTYPIINNDRYSAVLGLTVNNVTNKHNSYIKDTGEQVSEIGRQFIADVRFKF